MNPARTTSPGIRLRSLLKEARSRFPVHFFGRHREKGCDSLFQDVSMLQGLELDQASIQQAVESFIAGREPACEAYAINTIVGSCDQLSAICDRVLRLAVTEGICAESVVTTYGSGQRVSWRQVAKTYPELAGPLQKLAAITYGFEPVMICEMSTLVLADLLSTVMESEEWRQCFEMGLMPVVEHGQTLSVQPGAKITFATWDPCNREIREFAAGLAQIRGTLRYAAKHTIEGLQDLVVGTIPGMATIAWPARPVLRKVEQVFSSASEYSRAA